MGKIDEIVKKLGILVPLTESQSRDPLVEAGFVVRQFITAIVEGDKRLHKDDYPYVFEKIIDLSTKHYGTDYQSKLINRPEKLAETAYGWMDEEQSRALFRSMEEHGFLFLFHNQLILHDESALPDNTMATYRDWIESKEAKLSLSNIGEQLRLWYSLAVSDAPEGAEGQFIQEFAHLSEQNLKSLEPDFFEKLDENYARGLIFVDIASSHKKWMPILTQVIELANDTEFGIDRQNRIDTDWQYRQDFIKRHKKHTSENWNKHKAIKRAHYKNHPERLQRLFDLCERYDLLIYLDAAIHAKENVFPRGADRAYQAWLKQKGYDRDNLPNPALIETPTRIYKEVTPMPSKYSISDKQAFFDGVDIADCQIALLKQSGHTLDNYFDTVIRCLECAPNPKRPSFKHIFKKAHTQVSDISMRKIVMISDVLSSTQRGLNLITARAGLSEAKNIEAHRFMQDAYIDSFQDGDQRDYLFEAARRNNFIPELYFILSAHDSYAPEGTVAKLETWCEGKGIDLQAELEAYELPAMDDMDAIIAKGYAARQADEQPAQESPDAQTPIDRDVPKIVEQPSNVISKIPVVIVPDLLPDGDRYGEVPDLVEIFTDKQDLTPRAEREKEPRDDWFREALERNPHIDHAQCREFVNPLKTNDMSGRYYTVFHVVTLDGNTTQYAISSCKGQISYILKGDHGVMVEPDKAECMMDIPALRRERMVQTRRCRNKDGYINDMMEFAFRDSSQVYEQRKSNTRWKGVLSRANQLENSFIAFYCDTGRAPTKQDGLVIHGDLGADDNNVYHSLAELDTDWKLVDQSLHRGVILGLEDYKSLQAYARHMLGEGASATPTAEKVLIAL